MEENKASLGEALPAEMARVRGEVLPIYESLPKENGSFGVLMIRTELREAERAIMSGDVIAMLRAYEALKGWTC